MPRTVAPGSDIMTSKEGSPSPCNMRRDKVVISVDDTALFEDGGEPLRAQSMSKLNMLNAEDCGEDKGINKWPSFPRLGRQAPSINDARTYSTTNLYTDSLSPRVSLDNLSIGDERSRSRLSLQECGLVRSASAKAVDTLPPLDSSGGHQRLSGHFLSPTSGAEDKMLVSRSTSCPSMSNMPKSRSPSVSPRGSGSPSRRRPGPYTGTAAHNDLNLEGEVIQDLPIEPGQNFPDFFPDNLPVKDPGRERDGEKPMHTRRVRERLGLDPPVAPPATRPNGATVPRGSAGSTTSSSARKKDGLGVVNIGDIPTSVAQRVISEHDIYRPELDEKVKEKCLQWLNSLDNDH